MFAKAGLVVIGLGAISIGGVAVAKPHLLGMDYMPEFHALSKDSNYETQKTSDYSSGKFGSKYRNYLVGVTNKKEDENKNNQSWWEWAFRQLQKEGVSTGKFKVTKGQDQKVDKPYDDNKDAKALNQVCKAAYKANESDVGDSEDGNKFKKEKVWKYCSPLGKEPSKIKDNDYQGKIGADVKSEAISVEDKENEMFWTIREKEVQGKDDNFEKIPSTAISSTHFSNRDLPMKELCRKAYETQKGSNGTTPNPTADETKKYCKFEISES